MLRSERGQGLVELALVLPLLILLLAGTVDLGRAFFSYIEITNAAREGARAGSRMPCHAGDAVQRQAMKTSITNAAVAEAADSGVTLTAGNIFIIPDPVSTGCPTPTAHAPLRVRVDLTFNTILGAGIGWATIDLSNWAEMLWFGNDDA